MPITLVLFLAAPLSGRAAARIPLRVPFVAGLLLIGISLLLMRGLTVSDGWTYLLPGFLVAGLAAGVISPALAAAMVSVLSVERSGLALRNQQPIPPTRHRGRHRRLRSHLRSPRPYGRHAGAPSSWSPRPSSR